MYALIIAIPTAHRRKTVLFWELLFLKKEDNAMKEVCIEVVAKDAEQQQFISTVLEKVQQEFPQTKIDVTTASKKLIPEEIILIIAINIVSTTAAEIILRILDRVWKDPNKGNIRIKSSTLDQAQEKVENYLRDKRVIGFQIVKREDKGLYVHLIYKTANSVHTFHISKSDLEIIRYEESELT